VALTRYGPRRQGDIVDSPSRVLVAYSTAGGSTASIAERIAGVLRGAGAAVDCGPAGPELDPATVDAVVVGSAVHNMAWLAPSLDLLARVPAVATPPVWCFSVGGLSHPDRTRTSRWMAGRELRKIEQTFPPARPVQDHRLFAGVVDLGATPLWGRLFFRAMGGRSGDQRDWVAVEAWASSIARHLLDTQAAPPGRDRP
jgi:menaquinone-dependent protoporphyrinogen oxidase